MTTVDPSLVESTDEVSREVVKVNGIPISAYVSRVQRPRAVILALHGGAAMSAYFDNPERPRSSAPRSA
jgi:hypothetical protein